jgi:hypothetical protein
VRVKVTLMIEMASGWVGLVAAVAWYASETPKVRAWRVVRRVSRPTV